jgi:hypothetical protein
MVVLEIGVFFRIGNVVDIPERHADDFRTKSRDVFGYSLCRIIDKAEVQHVDDMAMAHERCGNICETKRECGVRNMLSVRRYQEYPHIFRVP